ncbi:MAG TPA: hypothetical protein VF626_02710 [Chthoniobacterales bacterium]
MEKRTLEQRLQIYDRGLSTVSAAVLVIGALLTIVTYLHDQRVKEREERKLRDQEIAQAQEQLQLRKRELAFAIFKEKREAYLALTDAACAIAACRNYEEVEGASKEFLKLYYGRAHIIADGDPDVYQKKIDFRKALATYLKERPSEAPDAYFEGLALDITDACKSHMDPRSLDATPPPNETPELPAAPVASPPPGKSR